jgi:hypothetical protein
MPDGKKQNPHEMENSINPLFNVQEVHKMGMIINPYRFGIPFTGILDTYSGATAGYSLRKLRSAYTGYCIEVRRSLDDATQNIGFVNNVLDESALTTFVGANDGFVKTWYDQAGSYNLIQSTNSKQPQIISSGSIITLNNKPSLQFIRASSHYLYTAAYSSKLSQPGTIVFVCNKKDNSGYFFDGLNDDRWAQGNDTWMFAGSAPSGAFQAGSLNSQQLGFYIFNTANSYAYHNGSKTLDNKNVGNNTLGGITLGKWVYGNNYFDGYSQEHIVYNSDKSSDRSSIETAINSFYTIY